MLALEWVAEQLRVQAQERVGARVPSGRVVSTLPALKPRDTESLRIAMQGFRSGGSSLYEVHSVVDC